MKYVLAIALVGLGCLCNISAQKIPKKNTSDIQQTIIKKQLAVDDLDSEAKNVPFAAVRIFVRNQIAAKLWINGKDETGRAEDLAVKAFEETYDKKSEIPEIYLSMLRSDILGLLETNAPAAAKQLSEKYNIGIDESLDTAYSLLDKKGGEKIVSEKLRNSITAKNELTSTESDLINELAARKSPELPIVLSELSSLQESGKSDFSAESLFSIVDVFRNKQIQNDLRLRFYRIILKKAGETSNLEENDLDSIYNLLYAIVGDISKNAPNLLPQTMALAASLKSRITDSKNDEIETFDKIEKSEDRLSALISEAEETENKSKKSRFYAEASQLALKQRKFKLAVDLLEKSQADINFEEEKNIPSLRWHDQFLSDVSARSLQANDTDASKYAHDKIIDKLTRADVLRKTALYYFGKQNPVPAIDALEESYKITNTTDNNMLKIRMLLRLIPTFQQINKTELPDITEKTAKAINSLPTLDIDDKPETENYKKYVGSIMAIDVNLLSTMSYLVKENKSEAVNLADRINRREVKIVADFTVLTNLEK